MPETHIGSKLLLHLTNLRPQNELPMIEDGCYVLINRLS